MTTKNKKESPLPTKEIPKPSDSAKSITPTLVIMSLLA